MFDLLGIALFEVPDICTEDAGTVGHPIVHRHAGRAGRRVGARVPDVGTSLC